MADIISSLFGLTPIQEEVDKKQRERQFGLGQLYGQATVNTMAPAARQQAYINKQGAQGALGGMAVRGLGSLFGVQDKELKRASDLESILNQTQQEVGGDPTQLYPLLQQRLADAGYTREAMQVGQMGAKEIQAAQLNQAKLLTEQAQYAKATQEKLDPVVRLQNAYDAALASGQTERAAQIKAVIDKQGYIAEKTLTPENKAQEAIYNKFVRDLGPEEGALAFDQYINQQKVKVAQGANPAIPVSVSNQGTPIGQYDEKGNLTTTKGKVIPKEEMISLREAADSSKGLYDIITSITPQDIDLAFGRVTDYSQAPDAVKLGVSPEILDAQTKINKLGVREVLTNLQNLKGASSDKEMTKIASTFPGYGAAPSVMKKWAARAMGTILDFTNRKSKEFGVDAPPVSLEELAANPIFNELSEAEKSDILFKLRKYDDNFSSLPENEQIKALGKMTKSKTNIDGKITDYGTSKVKRKSVGGVNYIFDGKGWRKE